MSRGLISFDTIVAFIKHLVSFNYFIKHKYPILYNDMFVKYSLSVFCIFFDYRPHNPKGGLRVHFQLSLLLGIL